MNDLPKYSLNDRTECDKLIEAVHLLNVNRNEVAVCVKKFKIGG